MVLIHKLLAGVLIAFLSVSASAASTDYKQVQKQLGAMVADGQITLDQAQVMLEALREHDNEVQVQAFFQWLESIGPDLAAKVEAGKLTEDQAWTQWLDIKENKIAPKIKHMVEKEMIGELEGWEIWFDIERHETGERMKAAVQKGEMTEEEAWVRWQAYEREMDAKWEELEEKLAGDEDEHDHEDEHEDEEEEEDFEGEEEEGDFENEEEEE